MEEGSSNSGSRSSRCMSWNRSRMEVAGPGVAGVADSNEERKS